MGLHPEIRGVGQVRLEATEEDTHTHTHITSEGSPINGGAEKTVQKALDQLANEGCLASLTSRYRPLLGRSQHLGVR